VLTLTYVGVVFYMARKAALGDTPGAVRPGMGPAETVPAE
jgi:hypothetical protein